MALEQTVLPPNMGYVGATSGSGEAATAAALAAIAAMNNNRQPYGDQFGLGGGLIGALLVGELLGGRRGFGGGERRCGDELAGDVASRVVELQNTSDLKGEIRGVEAGLRESILNQTIGNSNEFRALEGKIGTAALDAVKAQFEAKIAALQATNELSNLISAKTDIVERSIDGLRHDVDTKFFGISKEILNTTNRLSLEVERGNAAIQLQNERLFSKRLEDDLRKENDDLRRSRDIDRQTVAISSQFQAIASQLNTLRQGQQTIQFGTADVAIPTASSNQVK